MKRAPVMTRMRNGTDTNNSHGNISTASYVLPAPNVQSVPANKFRTCKVVRFNLPLRKNAKIMASSAWAIELQRRPSLWNVVTLSRSRKPVLKRAPNVPHKSHVQGLREEGLSLLFHLSTSSAMVPELEDCTHPYPSSSLKRVTN